MDDPHERLQAFCSITFDSCFVIRDLKIIQGAKGSFVAMPSRKLTDRCPRCHTKNHLRALHCNQCGAKLDEERATKDNDGRAKLYADIAHPINSDCRELIQRRVLEAYSSRARPLARAGLRLHVRRLRRGALRNSKRAVRGRVRRAADSANTKARTGSSRRIAASPATSRCPRGRPA